jgi:AcrR family transcriptional regulator
MASQRRMGPKGSEVWVSMLEAAERILVEEGAAALTSRLVADRTGVKQRLVYYYFRTMDELVVETFRRLAERERERLTTALESRHSLRDLWNVYQETADTRLTSEFMALSHRIEDLRIEVRNHVEACRQLQITALTRAMGGRKRGAIPAAAAALLAMSAALIINREKSIGVSTGHEEVLQIIAAFVDRFDPEDA